MSISRSTQFIISKNDLYRMSKLLLKTHKLHSYSKGCGITYKNKAKNGRNNICGQTVRHRRRTMRKISQRKFADLLQLNGLDIDKNAIQRIESGKRFVTDIELHAIAGVFQIQVDELLQDTGKTPGTQSSRQQE